MPIVTDGLTSHWDFKDGAGTTITDIVGANDGTLQGTTTNFWNRVDNAGESVGNFNGSDNRITTGISSFPSGDWSTTQLFWPNLNSYANFGLLTQFHSANQGFNSRVASAGIQVGFEGATVRLETFPYDELWQMWLVLQISYTSATSAYRIRLGKDEITGTHTIGTSPASNLNLGSGPTSNRFSGRMGDVLWYDGKALSVAEMDDNLDALLARARGSLSITTPDTSHSKTIITLPDDGLAIDRPNANQPVVMSSADKIYVAEFVEVDPTTGTPNYYRFDKNWTLEETIAPFGNSTAEVEGSHKTPTIGVDVSGKILMYPGQHGGEWLVKRSNSADDLDPSTTVADPGLGTSLTYAYFYRSPSTGTAYFGVQDSDKYGWWVDDGSAFTRLGGANHYDGASQQPYWGHLIEGPDGKLYSLTSWHDGSAGGPFHHVNIIYSVDGTTWKRLTDDATVTLPASHLTADAAISRTLEATGSGDITDSDFSGSTPRPAVCSDGSLHWVLGWSNNIEGDSTTLRSVWYVRWNPIAKHFEHYRLLSDDGSVNAGSGYIARNPADDSLHIFLSGRASTAFNVYLYSSFDQGDTWERRILHDQSVAEVRSGNPPDLEGLRIDGEWRTRILYEADKSTAEVWEYSLPVAKSSDGVGLPVVALQMAIR